MYKCVLLFLFESHSLSIITLLAQVAATAQQL